MQTSLTIQKHAYKLSKILLQMPHKNEEKFHLASEWLNLASSINTVSIITEQYDDSLFMCGPALEYENEKSKTLEKVVRELSIFNFIWGAFESVSKAIEPPNINIKKRRTIIDDVMFYLKNNFTNEKVIPEYSHKLNILEFLIKKDTQYIKNIDLEKIYDNRFMNDAGKALALIRIIRNDFAHGSHSFPEPDDWNMFSNFNENDYITRIVISSKLMLLTIQMILIVCFKDNIFSIIEYQDYEEYEINIIEKLLSIHI